MCKQIAPQKDVFLRFEHVKDRFPVAGFLFVVGVVGGKLTDKGFSHVNFLSVRICRLSALSRN